MSSNPAPRIIIVGGSLTGLTLALACAARGVPVRVVERSVQRTHGGDSLSVDLAALATATGHDPRTDSMLPVVPAYRDRHLTTWPALYDWLRSRVLGTANIFLEEGRMVVSVTQADNGVHLNFSDGTGCDADMVIGADGYHSQVRRSITSHAPWARYAGYLVWRGLVEERMLKRPVAWPSHGGLWIDFAQGYRLVAAVLPGRDGSLDIGRRQVTFAWFDAHQAALLRRTQCLTEDGFIVATLGRGTIESSTREALMDLVPQVWPQEWLEAVTAGVASSTALSGAPIAEYLPERLVYGRVALVGDAAHVMSPMTGSGFASGVEDAMVLARGLAERPVSEPIVQTLMRYEQARLPYVRGLVMHSRQLSARFVAQATP